MLKLFRFIIILSICSFFLSGCIPQATKPADKMQAPALKINIPDRFFVSKETTPIDIKMVCAGMLNTMRKRGDTPFVSFYPGVNRGIQEDMFRYEGFNVILTDITGFEAKIISKNKVQGILEGVFHFEDFVGRRASAYFASRYLKTPDGIVIEEAGITNIPPLFPRVEAYLIPLEVINRAPGNALRGYWQMYAFALEHSLDMKPTAEERRAHEAYESLSTWKKLTAKKNMEKMEMAVMIFCLDRLSEDARFEIKVMESEFKECLVEPGYINENGWPVAVVTGEFVPDEWRSPFEIKAFYTPEGRNEKLLIGVFSNQKDYRPKPQQAEVQTQTRQPAPSNVQKPAPSMDQKEDGPVASGSVFLNPFLKLDARIIQKRLADLGYYTMKIDGAFGKNSQKAVQMFKKDNGLGNNPTWDIRTQKALFKGSDL